MSSTKRIAINVGGGFVPGLNAVVTGVVRAAGELGWSVAGIRDGFDGLLFPERYPDGGLVPLTGNAGDVLGNATRTNPFCVRHVNAENQVEEVDLSGALIERTRANGLAAVISVVGPQALSILFKLHRRGLTTICVPTSVENDVAATQLSFGFNSALSFAVDMLERVSQAARAAGKIGVVEVPGGQGGWLALQAGIAVCADAVLIPEIPYDLHAVSARLRRRIETGQGNGLVVVAEGAAPREDELQPAAVTADSFKASLSPGATGRARSHVIDRSGLVAKTVALELQRLTDHATFPLVLGELVKGGPPTAVDRQLGLAYGAGAVRGLHAGLSGVMVSFQPPDLTFVPLAEAINRTRTVPADGMFLKVARALGISLGEGEVRS